MGINGLRRKPAKESAVIFPLQSARPDRRSAKWGRRRQPPCQASASANREQLILSCKKEIDFIPRYLAADLDGDLLRAFENHLRVCPDCAAFLHTYKTTMELTKSFLAHSARRAGASKLSLATAKLHRL